MLDRLPRDALLLILRLRINLADEEKRHQDTARRDLDRRTVDVNLKSPIAKLSMIGEGGRTYGRVACVCWALQGVLLTSREDYVALPSDIIRRMRLGEASKKDFRLPETDKRFMYDLVARIYADGRWIGSHHWLNVLGANAPNLWLQPHTEYVRHRLSKYRCHGPMHYDCIELLIEMRMALDVSGLTHERFRCIYEGLLKRIFGAFCGRAFIVAANVLLWSHVNSALVPISPSLL
jgi:hypothetical protein